MYEELIAAEREAIAALEQQVARLQAGMEQAQQRINQHILERERHIGAIGVLEKLAANAQAPETAEVETADPEGTPDAPAE